MSDPDKRPEKETDKLYERTVKNLLNTPPEKKRGAKKRPARRDQPGDAQGRG